MEWKQNRHRQAIDMTAEVTESLSLWIGEVGTGLGWMLEGQKDGEGTVSGIGEAQDRALDFAREWVAAQAAALGDGWVSVEERLPEEYIRVLCRLTIGAGGTEGGWAVGSYAREFGWMTDGIPPQERHHYTTTHWRSLPPLPVAEVEE